MARLVLLIGDRATSEGSLQAFLALRLANVLFELEPWGADGLPGLDGPWLPEPPVLLVDEVPIWDALAIAEFLAEHAAGLWPTDPRARALARSVAHEVHAGFRSLRTFLPFDLLSSFGPPGRLPRSAERDLEGIACVWRACRRDFGGVGRFLFGPFGLADAMFAPIALRLVRASLPLDPASRDYAATLVALPWIAEWIEAARRDHRSFREPPDALTDPGSSHRTTTAADDATAYGAPVADLSNTPPLSGPSATIKPIGAGTRRRH